MSRAVKALAWTLGILLGLPLLLMAVVLLTANIQPGRDFIERIVPKVTGGECPAPGAWRPFPHGLARGADRGARPGRHVAGYREPDPGLGAFTPAGRRCALSTLSPPLQGSKLARLPVSSPEPSESSGVSLPVPDTAAVARCGKARPGAGGGRYQGAPRSRPCPSRLPSSRATWLLDYPSARRGGQLSGRGSSIRRTLAGQLTAEEPANGPVARLAGLEDVGAVYAPTHPSRSPTRRSRRISPGGRPR